MIIMSPDERRFAEAALRTIKSRETQDAVAANVISALPENLHISLWRVVFFPLIGPSTNRRDIVVVVVVDKSR